MFVNSHSWAGGNVGTAREVPLLKYVVMCRGLHLIGTVCAVFLWAQGLLSELYSSCRNGSKNDGTFRIFATCPDSLPMITIDQPLFLAKRVTIKVLRDYILDVGIADTDTILLNQIDFDELALEYRQTYQEHLPVPYLLVRVLVREDGRGLVPRGHIVIIENDTESLRVNPGDLFDPHRVIYRCHNCGTLVGPDGEELDPGQFRQDADYLNKFGKEVPVEHKRGGCCDDMWKPKDSPSSHPEQVDYSGIEGKPLMQLTEEDFQSIGLSRGTAADFDIIYTCKNTSRGKIYFTPNETSYSLRGYRLREIEKVFSTEQLVKALQDWRRK